MLLSLRSAFNTSYDYWESLKVETLSKDSQYDHYDNKCGNPEMQRAVTWQGLGPLDDPQQLFLTQPVETVEQKMWNFGL